MKRKITCLVGLIVIAGVVAFIFAARQKSPFNVENDLPRAMSNYQKTFKLDTSPAIFPDGKTTNASNKTSR